LYLIPHLFDSIYSRTKILNFYIWKIRKVTIYKLFRLKMRYNLLFAMLIAMTLIANIACHGHHDHDHDHDHDHNHDHHHDHDHDDHSHHN